MNQKSMFHMAVKMIEALKNYLLLHKNDVLQKTHHDNYYKKNKLSTMLASSRTSQSKRVDKNPTLLKTREQTSFP